MRSWFLPVKSSKFPVICHVRKTLIQTLYSQMQNDYREAVNSNKMLRSQWRHCWYKWSSYWLNATLKSEELVINLLVLEYTKDLSLKFHQLRCLQEFKVQSGNFPEPLLFLKLEYTPKWTNTQTAADIKSSAYTTFWRTFSKHAETYSAACYGAVAVQTNLCSLNIMWYM